MSDRKGSNRVPPMWMREEDLVWIGENFTEMKQWVSGQRFLYQSLVFGFILGLAAHSGGYALLSSGPSGFLGLLADLLYALGWSLWTGVFVAMFTQIMPEVKRRQITQLLDAYEAMQKEK